MSGVRWWVLRLLIVVVVAIYAVLALVLIKSYHHEFAHLPGIVDCRRGDAMTLGPVESTRKHGFIVKREFAGCTFYWHEAN
jgi:hypothetical protein